MILDTSFLLDLKDGDEDAFSKAIEMYDTGVIQRVGLPSVMELHYGAAFTRSDEERRRVRNLLLMYPVVGLDEELARRVGELLAAADAPTAIAASTAKTVSSQRSPSTLTNRS